MSAVLIDPAELASRLGDERLVVLDVRWSLPDAHARFLDGHVPRAAHVDMDSDLADSPGPGSGRHPLPRIDRLQAAARRWGVRDDSIVVAYDESGNLAAARAWWLLRWAGMPDVRLLDGGLPVWRDAGMPVETGEEREAPLGDVTLSAGHLPVLEADDAALLAVEGILLDARSAERYRGEEEPMDPVAGHIPNAVSAPTTENLVDGSSVFASAETLTARFCALGVEHGDNVGVYCGSGVTAAHEIAALAIAGFTDVALYVGSWSQWLSDPARPVATGAEPDPVDERTTRV